MDTTVDLSLLVEKDLHFKEIEEIQNQVCDQNIDISCVDPMESNIRLNVCFLLEYKIREEMQSKFKENSIKEALILNL